MSDGLTARLVWAQSRNGVIGHAGSIPWHLPEDLARFRELTMGSVCVMGRRTWESLPAAFRPLPGRENVVLTSAGPLLGAHTLTSVAEVCDAYEEVWVIGGAAVYAAFLPWAVEIYVTEVDLEVPGDVFAPELPGDWERTSSGPQVSSTGLRYAFTELRRRPASAPEG